MKTRLVEDFICANLEPLRVYVRQPFIGKLGRLQRKSTVVVRTTHEMGAAFMEWKADLKTVRWQHVLKAAPSQEKKEKTMKAIPSKEELRQIERATMGNDPYYDGPFNRKLRWRVLAIMSAWHQQNGTTATLVRWWTVQDLAVWANGTETSVSSALRDLRKKHCGGYVVIRRRGKGGLSEYSLLPGSNSLGSSLSVAVPDVITEAMKHGDSMRLVVNHELA